MCGGHIFLSFFLIQMISLRKSLQTNFRLLATVHMLQTYLCGVVESVSLHIPTMFVPFNLFVQYFVSVCVCAFRLLCSRFDTVNMYGVGFSCHFNFQFNIRISFPSLFFCFCLHCFNILQPFINLVAFSDSFIRIRNSFGKNELVYSPMQTITTNKWKRSNKRFCNVSDKPL